MGFDPNQFLEEPKVRVGFTFYLVLESKFLGLANCAPPSLDCWANDSHRDWHLPPVQRVH